MKKARGASGQNGPVWRTMADISLDVSIYKPPFSVPFWTGTTNDTYYDPPVGSFGLGSEDEAGIYDEPGRGAVGRADALGRGDLSAPGLTQPDARRRHKIPLAARFQRGL